MDRTAVNTVLRAPMRVSKRGGVIWGMCPPPPEPNVQRKNLRILNDLLDDTNELIREILSQ